MLKKPAETSTPINALLQERWSPRSFASKPVSSTDLTAILEAARWAPSCNNGQPWRFMVASSGDAAGYAAALEGFNVRNQRWAKTAPVLVFVLARKTFEANGTPNGYAGYDSGAAVAMLTVEAEARGLRVHQAAGIEKDKVRAIFGVPDEFEVMSGLAIGYQGDPDALPEDLPGREREPRARKALSDIAFTGKFGAPVKLG